MQVLRYITERKETADPRSALKHTAVEGAKLNLVRDGQLNLIGFLVNKRKFFIFALEGNPSDPDVRDAFAHLMRDQARSVNAQYAAVLHDSWQTTFPEGRLAELGLTRERFMSLPREKRHELIPPKDAILCVVVSKKQSPEVLIIPYSYTGAGIKFEEPFDMTNITTIESRWTGILVADEGD